MELIYADYENDIIDILKKYNFWDNTKCWRTFGDRENNFSIINNQSRNSDAALVEKLINSIDARLINECLIKKIDPESQTAPKTVREAVGKFFGDNPNSNNSGVISNWTNIKRTEISRGITLAATGAKPYGGDPSYTIVDIGEGKTPDDMPTTFLSIAESNKLRTPFVHGKYNQGGTGVLKFCGKYNFQLILTKRNPNLLPKNALKDDHKWGFTIIRREPPAEGRVHSMFTYLAPLNVEEKPKEGDVLRFKADELPLFPEGNKPYERNTKWGTLIKLYEYLSEGFRSNILMKSGLLSHMDLLLTSPALPIRLHECREYGGKKGSYDTTLAGIQVRLVDDKNENLEVGFPTSFTMNINGEPLKATIYAFCKDKDKTYRRSEGVLFTINGQTHDIWTTDFFRRKSIGLSLIYSSILVIVDCSELSYRTREDLFPSSRDRMSNNEFKKNIEEELELELKNNQLIRDLKERRHRELIQSKLENDKPLEETLKFIFKKHPILSKLFLDGERISNPLKTIGVKEIETEYVGKKHPTYFKFKGKEYGFDLHRDANLGLRCRISFETDVVNDYFDREMDKGYNELFYELNGTTCIYPYNNRMNLENGIATLNIKLPEEAKVGDRYKYICKVYDRTLVEPFKNGFSITVKEPIKISKGNGNRKNPPSNEKGDERENQPRIAFPPIQRVNEIDWNKYTPPFDKYTALRIIFMEHDENSNKDIYEFYINMDNIYLLNELKTRINEQEIIKTRFEVAMVIIGLSLIQFYDKDKHAESADDKTSENKNGNSVEDKIEETTKALAPIILPLIDSVGSIDLETEQTIEFTGEN